MARDPPSRDATRQEVARGLVRFGSVATVLLDRIKKSKARRFLGERSKTPGQNPLQSHGGRYTPPKRVRSAPEGALLSVRNLEQLFKPTSVAVIGADNEPGSPGHVVMQNLLAGKFLGPVMPVNPDLTEVLGHECYRDVDTLPLTPDLALICTDPDAVPGYVRDLGIRGVGAAVLLSRVFSRSDRREREIRRGRILAAARESGMRLLGPNCLGFINTGIGLNASLAHRDALPGRIAFVSQSDSLFSSVLDWAASGGIGFSYCISLGDRMDILFDNVLDFLDQDPGTRAILLYLETILSSRRFMSAARSAARSKPVLVIKSGSSAEGAEAAAMYSGALLGADDVYDAAFRRAGMLRVFEIDSLFDTVETLARTRLPKGDRLAVLTNGGSPAFLAVDALSKGGGHPAELEEETKDALEKLLGAPSAYWNPLVLSPTAQPQAYAEATSILLRDRSIDALLVMHVPTFASHSGAIAEAVTREAKKSKKVVLTSWLGQEDAAQARHLFAEAGIPSFLTPEKAVRGFLNLVQYRRNQELLMEMPPSLPEEFDPDVQAARRVAEQALAQGRQDLTEPEAKAMLAAYEIAAVETIETPADDPEQVVAAALELGLPVAVKVISQDIRGKSELGGVALDLETVEAVREAAAGVQERVLECRPGARIEGLVVQRMHLFADAHELSVEASVDPVFGPIIRFGQGGGLREIDPDREVGLPPLNMGLARDLISRTRVFKLLKGYGDHPPADLNALCLTLIKISQMIIDLPEIVELEINPLYADTRGVVALDAHIRLGAAEERGGGQLAIRPYPRELEETARLRDGRQVILRPIRPEDETAHWDFLHHLSSDDMRFRFFGNIGRCPGPR